MYLQFAIPYTFFTCILGIVQHHYLTLLWLNFSAQKYLYLIRSVLVYLLTGKQVIHTITSSAGKTWGHTILLRVGIDLWRWRFEHFSSLLPSCYFYLASILSLAVLFPTCNCLCAADSGSSCPSSSFDCSHCVAFLGTMLHFHGEPFHLQ